MTDSDPADDRIEEIAEAARHIPGTEWRTYMDGVSWWALQAARRAAFLLGRDPVVYATGVPYGSPDFSDQTMLVRKKSKPGRFVIFSRHLVVDSHISEADDPQSVKTRTRIVSRTQLREIRPSDNDLTSWSTGAQWPASLNLDLYYDGLDEPIKLLPDGTEQTHSILRVVKPFVPSLFRDLCRESAVSWDESG